LNPGNYASALKGRLKAKAFMQVASILHMWHTACQGSGQLAIMGQARLTIGRIGQMAEAIESVGLLSLNTMQQNLGW